MPESNVIPFAPFAARRRRADRRPAESRDKPYAGGGIDELWVGDGAGYSAVIVPLR
jgi:hypothetical protein